MMLRRRWQLVLSLTVLLLFPCLINAQQVKAPVITVLSPASDAVLDKLASYSAIPTPVWRYHVGDMAHGEDVALDDSSWPIVDNPSKLPAQALWLRATIEVPKDLNGYDPTGAEISFRMDVEANGPLPQIVYFNGRRVAMGTDLEPIPLFYQVHPGDKVQVAVKLLHTEDVKRFRGSHQELSFVSSRPSPSDFRTEAITAALLIPALRADPAGPLKELESAIQSVNTAALASGNQAAFDASLRQAQSAIDPLKPILHEANVHLTGNSHIDAAWLWPWTETVEVVRQTFGTALQLLNEYPNYTYTASAAQYYDWVEQKYPSEFDQIQQRVKEGRWEVVGGMWVEPDLNMPCGESQVRQLLIGQRYFQKSLGAVARIGWNPDSFGYNWQLPQIYKRSGLDYFVTQKMAWNDTNPLPLKLFWWQSPDGSRVLTYFPHDYDLGIEPVMLAQDFAVARSHNPGTGEMLHLYGIGDHGGGPTRAMLDDGDHWSQPNQVVEKFNFGVAQQYFTDVESRLDTAHSPVWNYQTFAAGNTTLPQPPAGEMSLPVWNDELYFEYHRGVYTSQSNHKRSMRTAEEEMLDAEKWSSIAWLSGTPYPADQLNDAWKKVLFNQFHDLAAGSGIAPIYKDAQKDYRLVSLTTAAATSTALDAIASYVNTQGSLKEVPVLIFNPLAWTRTDVVNFSVQMPADISSVEIVDRAGKVVDSESSVANAATHTFQVQALVHDVPSLGYQLVFARPAAHPAATAATSSSTTMENAFLRVKVDPKSGCITSLVNKQTGFDAIAQGGCGNLLQAFKDTPKEYDAWNIDSDIYDVVTNLDAPESVQLVEHSSLRDDIRVTRHWQSSTFVQDLILYKDLPRVEVVNDIDWHERHILLKAAFPLAASGPYATYEIPYGSIQRPTTRTNSVDKAKFEVPALTWADLGDQKNGFSLINESKYGYDAKDNVLRLSLLRGPTWPDPDADQGHHHFSYALYPHGGDWKEALTERQGYDFNYHLTALQVAPHAGNLPGSFSFLATGADNVVVTALKKTEDGDGLLIRFFEWAGKPADVSLTLPGGVISATEANLMEKPEGPALTVSGGNQITVPVTPYEIQTVIVHYPAPNQDFLAGVAKH